MKAVKCDRCGKYYDKNEKIIAENGKRGERIEGIATLMGKGDYCRSDKQFDLCDDCLEKIIGFVKNAEDLENGTEKKEEILEILHQMRRSTDRIAVRANAIDNHDIINETNKIVWKIRSLFSKIDGSEERGNE